MGLVHTLAESAKLNDAEQVIRAGMQIEPSRELTRGLSEVFRLRYLISLKQDGSSWTGDLQMLDTAMRTDPTNPMVGEEIAKLARLNGSSPGDELIKKLQQFLAEGKATAATHAWIAELYLIRRSYAQALPYLEQVVNRLPNSAQYLNNLAYVLAEIAPDRRQDALAYAQRAVQLDPSSADYYDTLAKVLAGLNRPTEAITALESAIERQPGRKDFHEGITSLYEVSGNLPMAEQHRIIVKRIAEKEAKAASAKSKTATEAPNK
jgi:tetratricopeptide (TPR) repeat protein